MRSTLAVTLAVALSAGTAAASQFPDFITTKNGAFSGFSRYDPATVTLQSIGYPPVTWSIVGGALPLGLTLSSSGVVGGTPSAAGPFSVTVKAIDIEGRWGTRTYTGSVYPVPKPKPIDIPYTLSAYYMPKPTWPGHQWADLRLLNEKNTIKTDSFGQRMPLLGYYQGDSVEVLDWQIKMAVDRGITNWMFQDYWDAAVDRPTYEGALNAFLSARYRSSMTFAPSYNYCLVPERTPASTRACFIDKVVPYYVAHYFNQPNALRVNGRPVVVIGSPWYAFALGYGPAAQDIIREILDAADVYIHDTTGAPGAYWITGDMGFDGGPVDFSRAQAAGFDAVSPGGVLPSLWPLAPFPIVACQPMPDGSCSPIPNGPYPPGVPYPTAMAHAVTEHKNSFVAAQQSGLKFMAAPYPDFDFRWIFWSTAQLYFDGQNQAAFIDMLAQVRALVDTYVALAPVSGATGKPMVGVGSWNEWGESSTVEPGRNVFSRSVSADRSPFFVATALARAFGGPASGYDTYDPGYPERLFPATSSWTFTTATGAGLDVWNSATSAGLSLGPGDVLVAAASDRVVLNTPTFVPTAGYQRIKVLVRVDQGAARLGAVAVHTRSSDYTDDAHHFEAPVEPGHQFFNIVYPVPASIYTTVDGFRLYSFEVGAVTSQWQGKLKYIEVRFEPCVQPPAPPGTPTYMICAHDTPITPVRYSIKRVWLE